MLHFLRIRLNEAYVVNVLFKKPAGKFICRPDI